MKYMIHTHPKRLWYVQNYLVKDMLKQGIKKEDIIIVNDSKGLGNLQAFINSLELVTDDTWHLQDDVLLSSKFKIKTEVLGKMNMIVSGFCFYDFNMGCTLCQGFTRPIFMYMTFPCIFIPKRYSDEFKEWVKIPLVKEKHKTFFESGKCDDQLFYQYVLEIHRGDEIYNCYECLVDHVDYLLGGSSINERDGVVRATYWYENERNIELEKELKEEGKINDNRKGIK